MADDELTENEDELEDIPADALSDDDDELEAPYAAADDDGVAATTDDDSDDDEDDDEEDDDEEDESTPQTRRRKASEEEDEEMLAPDDVEADLDRILKDRMVTTDEEDDEEEEPEVGDDQLVGAENGSRLQPKRADEQLCDSCFLLVRATAPTCPVGDDDCPIFS